MTKELSHFDDHGGSRMVNVAEKEITSRFARSSAQVRMSPSTLALVRDGQTTKGNVLEVARLAGIMAAKRASELIPLCHQVALDAVSLDFEFPDDQTVSLHATAQATARTGVEMEALVAVSVAALTIYDMCKSADRAMVIEQVQLEEKFGGRSGHYRRLALSERSEDET